jgi:hypothetical protein
VIEPDLNRPDQRAERCIELGVICCICAGGASRTTQETNADCDRERAEASANWNRRRDDRRADVSRTGKWRRWSGLPPAPLEDQPARRRIADGEVEPEV